MTFPLTRLTLLLIAVLLGPVQATGAQGRPAHVAEVVVGRALRAASGTHPAEDRAAFANEGSVIADEPWDQMAPGRRLEVFLVTTGAFFTQVSLTRTQSTVVVVTTEEEKARIEKAIVKNEQEKDRLGKKLSNEKFIANADPDVVAADRERHAELEVQLESLKIALQRVIEAG